ncbi:MAG: hypothetical protein Q7R35_14310 [Elusimicrobiota bacterium]|nr:hypothetical protein [Elusimicrobiota bacterium]
MTRINTENWFVPVPEEFPPQRAALDLGLTRANRYYRELVAPGIGGVWFARQISWAVAGIALGQELGYRPSKVANGIEALAGKLEWHQDSDSYSGKGKLVFGRKEESDVWDFKRLSTREHYVQSTYRMPTVRALHGLNIAEGTRFNSMQLQKTGPEIAELFFKQNAGNTTLKTFLIKWLRGKEIPHTGEIIGALCKSASNYEGYIEDEKIKAVIQNRLFAVTQAPLSGQQAVSTANQDRTISAGAVCSRRKNLIETFSHRVTAPSPEEVINSLTKKGLRSQVKEIRTAIAFDNMLKAGRDVIIACAERLDSTKPPRHLHTAIKPALNAFREKAKRYRSVDGANEAKEIKCALALASHADKSSKKLLAEIVNSDGNILILAEGQVIKGNLFDNYKRHDSPVVGDKVGTEGASTNNKIEQLFELWRSCK